MRFLNFITTINEILLALDFHHEKIEYRFFVSSLQIKYFSDRFKGITFWGFEETSSLLFQFRIEENEASLYKTLHEKYLSTYRLTKAKNAKVTNIRVEVNWLFS